MNLKMKESNRCSDRMTRYVLIALAEGMSRYGLAETPDWSLPDTYLLTYSLTHSLNGAESLLRT